MDRYGFARDKEFDLLENDGNRISLKPSSAEKTIGVYPFDFELFLKYRLIGSASCFQGGIKNFEYDIEIC